LMGMQGQRGRTRNIMDPDNPERILGQYRMLTSSAYLHGDYQELTARLDDAARKRQELADDRENIRKRQVAERNALADRLDKLAMTGYHAATYESPGSMISIKVGDLEQ